MRLNNLKVEQHIAINYLSIPNKAGMTYTEIAEKCGVNRRTLHRWRNDPFFDAELKRRTRRILSKHLPEILEALANAIIEDGNAAAAKLFLQLMDVLPSSKVVDDNLQVPKDEVDDTLDYIQERIRKYKSKRDV